MRTIKLAIGIVLALVLVVYSGTLFFYFLDTAGSAQGSVDLGLGPTLLGLGTVGLLLCIPVVWKLLRALQTPRSRAPRAGAPVPDAAPAFDADAALARYLARKTAEGDTRLASDGSALTRPGFGRKGL